MYTRLFFYILFITAFVVLCLSSSFIHAEEFLELVYINGDSENISDIEIDTNGDIYVSSLNQGLWKFSNGFWHQLSSLTFNDISIDNHNVLWAYRLEMLCKYADNTWSTYDIDENLHPVNYIDVSQDNIVWIASLNFCKIDKA